MGWRRPKHLTVVLHPGQTSHILCSKILSTENLQTKYNISKLIISKIYYRNNYMIFPETIVFVTYLLYSTISGSHIKSHGILICVIFEKSFGSHTRSSSNQCWSNQTFVVITCIFSSFGRSDAWANKIN